MHTAAANSAWSPFRLPVFRALWIATLVSNIGTWMHDIGAGWLMTTLSPSPVMVALVQTATTLPVFLLALPAGALADIIDRRRHLIVTQVFMAITAGCLAVIALTGITTPWMLVALTFAMGLGTAMTMPAWAAIVPELVPRSELPAAIALNSMGINVARAIGPAIAGVIVSVAGSGAVFALNTLSFVEVIAVLYHFTVEYTVREEKVPEFLRQIRQLGRHRRRDGAFTWGVFEDTERPCHFIETFSDESWLAHLRQHARVTVETKSIQLGIRACLAKDSEPVVTHYLSPE